MTKWKFRVLVCVVLLSIAIALTACTSGVDALQARIEALEAENAELHSTISSLRTDLEKAYADLLSAQSEVQILQSEQDDADDQAAESSQSGPLAITYGGEPNKDMSWPLDYGDLPLRVRIDFNEFDEDVEIVWHSTNEKVLTVVSDEDGLSATVTPLEKGSAEVVVKVGDQETRSWVRIT